MPSLIATLSMMQKPLRFLHFQIARASVNKGLLISSYVTPYTPTQIMIREGFHSADYYWGYSIFHYFGNYSVLVPDPDELAP